MKPLRHETGLPFRPRYRPLPPVPELQYARPGWDDAPPLSRALRLGSALGIYGVIFGAAVILTGLATGVGALWWLLSLSVLAAAVGFPCTLVGALRRRSHGWLLHLSAGFLFNGIILASVALLAYVIVNIGG